MIRRTLLTLLALVLVTGVTACGGGGDDDSADTPSDRDADTGAEAGQGAETTTTPSTAPGAGAPDGEPAPGTDGAPGGVATQLGVDRTFTGEGSQAFCAAVEAIQASGAADPAAVDESAFADQMAAIPPPAEIASEWSNLFTVQKAIASDPSGNALADLSQEELDAWGMSGAVVAAYLGDVCGLTEGAG